MARPTLSSSNRAFALSKPYARALVAGLVLLATALPVVAQSWRGGTDVEIRVLDRKKKPLAGARVELTYRDSGGLESPAPLIADSKGRVIFYDLPSGAWHLEASQPGHLSFLAVLSVPATGKPEITASFLQASGGGIAPTRVVVNRIKKAGQRIAFQEATPKPRPAAPEPAVEEPAPVQVAEAETPTAAPVVEAPRPEARAAAEPPAAVPQVKATPTAEIPGEPARVEPVQSEPIQPEPIQPEPVQPEPTEPEPVRAEVAAPPTETPAAAAPDPTVQTPTPAVETPADEAPALERPEPSLPTPTPPPTPQPTPSPTPAEVPAAQPEPPTPVTPKPVVPETAAPPETTPAPVVPEASPSETAPAAVEPALPEPPVAAAPSVAPSEWIAAPARLGGSILRDPESAEWAAAEERVVPPGGDRPCPAGLEDAVRRAMWLVANAPSLEFAAYAGPVDDDSEDTAFPRLSAARQERIRELLAPYESSETGCTPIAVVLPKSAQFIGFHLLAADDSGAGTCEPKFDCPIGNGGWVATPNVGRGPSSTVIYGIFKNADPTRERRIRLTARFIPPSEAWQPTPPP